MSRRTSVEDPEIAFLDGRSVRRTRRHFRMAGQEADMRVPSPGTDRAALEVEDLLKIVLVLVVVWLVLEVIGGVLDILAWILGPLRPLIGLVVIVLIVLWLLDRI